MTVPCGLTPGAVGSNEASLTQTLVVPCTRPNELAPHFSKSSPIGTVEQRWTVMTLALDG